MTPLGLHMHVTVSSQSKYPKSCRVCAEKENKAAGQCVQAPKLQTEYGFALN